MRRIRLRKKKLEKNSSAQSSERTRLPKIRFSELPPELWQHILRRVEERKISVKDLEKLQSWARSAPCAPDGDSYKDFGSFILCGSGKFPKTILAKGMKAIRQPA